jgi:predicted TPR repeat methyltransferase
MDLQNTKLPSITLKKLVGNFKTYKGHVISFLKKHEHRLSNLIETNYHLGLFHMRGHKLNDAIFRFRLILYFRPNHYWALYQLSRCLYAKDKIEKAQRKLLRALDVNPEFVEATYLLSLIGNKETPNSIPGSIIEEYYNNLVSQYDEEFCPKNGYRIPEYLVDLLVYNLKDESKSYNVLDIGCGTGQCSGNLVSRITVDNLVGVDFSESMLEEAKKLNKKGLYVFSKLVKADYMQYLTKTANKYDIVIAGLSLHFHKNLSDILKKIKAVLVPGGVMAISIEKSFDNEKEVDFNYSFENFCYNKDYVEKEFKNAELQLEAINEYSIKNDRLAFVIICKN